MGNNNYSFTPLCRGGQGSFYEQFHVTASVFDSIASDHGQHQQLRGIRATYTGNAAEH